jgi:hypothetical protein
VELMVILQSQKSWLHKMGGRQLGRIQVFDSW